MNRETLKKSEIIRNKKTIESLLKSKNVTLINDMKFFVEKSDEIKYGKVFFSVSKKKIKKAVDRNKIKRRIKEAYRKNKYILSNNIYRIGIIYNSSKMLEYSEINRTMERFMQQKNIE